MIEIFRQKQWESWETLRIIQTDFEGTWDGTPTWKKSTPWNYAYKWNTEELQKLLMLSHNSYWRPPIFHAKSIMWILTLLFWVLLPKFSLGKSLKITLFGEMQQRREMVDRALWSCHRTSEWSSYKNRARGEIRRKNKQPEMFQRDFFGRKIHRENADENWWKN